MCRVSWKARQTHPPSLQVAVRQQWLPPSAHRHHDNAPPPFMLEPVLALVPVRLHRP